MKNIYFSASHIAMGTPNAGKGTSLNNVQTDNVQGTRSFSPSDDRAMTERRPTHKNDVYETEKTNLIRICFRDCSGIVPRLSRLDSLSLVSRQSDLATLQQSNDTSFHHKISRCVALLFAVLVMSIANIGVAWGYWYVPSEFYTEISWNIDCSRMNKSNYITYYAIPEGTYNFKLAVDNGSGQTWGNGNATNNTPTIITNITNGSGGNNSITINTTCNITFHITNEGSWSYEVTADAPTLPVKANFDNTGAWVWKTMTSNVDGTLSIVGKYGGCSGYNYRRTSREAEAGWDGAYISTGISVAAGLNNTDNSVFTYTPTGAAATARSMSIRKANTITATNHIYFDNSTAGWNTTNIYFVIGKSDYSGTYATEEVTNTHLHYASYTGDAWADGSYYAMLGSNSSFGSGSWGPSNLYAATTCSAPYLSAYNLATNCNYIIGMADGTKGSAITLTDKGNTASALNSTQTIQYALSTNNGSTYTLMSSGSTPGAISISAYKFVDGTYNSVTNTSNSQSISSNTTGTYSKSVDAAYTGATTLTASAGTGYTFVGWKIGTSETAASSPCYPTEATTYTARFKANVYSITYKDQGDIAFSGTQEGAPTSHTYGAATALKIPTKSGYTFGGWFTASDCASGAVGTAAAASLGATDYTANITLYAKWYANDYTFAVTEYAETEDTYKVNDVVKTSTGGSMKYTPVDDDSNARLYHFTDQYYVRFAYKKDNYTDKSRVTVYLAKALKAGSIITATINNPGSGTRGLKLQTSGGTDKATWTSNGDGNHTYKYVVTADDGLAGTSQFMLQYASGISNLVTLTVANSGSDATYTISLNGNGGTGHTSSVSATAGSSTLSASITNPTNSGYTFLGWYSGSGGTGDLVIDANGELQENTCYTGVGGIWAADNVTLYARWEENCYSFTPRVVAENVGIAADAEVETSSGGKMVYTPTGEGSPRLYYTTDGILFDTDGNCYVTVTLHHAMKEGTVLTAVISNPNNSKTRGLELKNASGSSMAVWTSSKAGSRIYTYTVQAEDDMVGSNVFKLQRHENAHLQSLTVSNCGSLMTYTVTLDSEGGSSGSESATVTYTSSTVSSITNPTKTGYTFSGWYSGDDGTDDLVINSSGVLQSSTDYTDSDGNWTYPGDVTLYAKWTANVYTVEEHNNGGRIWSDSIGSYTYGVGATLPTNVTKWAYDFDGWYDNSGLTGSAVTAIGTSETGNKDYYAKWTSIAQNYPIASHPEFLAAQEGDIIAVTVTGIHTSAAIYLYDLNYTEITHLSISATGTYTFQLSAAAATGIRTYGLLVSGTNFTFSDVDIRYRKTLWTGTLSDNSGWKEVAVDKSIFSGLSGGDFLGLNISAINDGESWHQYAMRADYDAVLSSMPTETGIGIHKLSAADVVALRDSDRIDITAQYLDISNLYSYTHTRIYTVTLTTNGGTINAGNVTSYTFGTGATLPTNVTKTGYTFAGWYDNSGLTGSAVTTITTSDYGNKEYWAKWTANNYTVTLNTNSGTINAGNVTSYTYGVGATLPTNVTKTGYTFAGWYDNSGCTGDAVATITTSDYGNKEYWANWTEIAQAISSGTDASLKAASEGDILVINVTTVGESAEIVVKNYAGDANLFTKVISATGKYVFQLSSTDATALQTGLTITGTNYTYTYQLLYRKDIWTGSLVSPVDKEAWQQVYLTDSEKARLSGVEDGDYLGFNISALAASWHHYGLQCNDKGIGMGADVEATGTYIETIPEGKASDLSEGVKSVKLTAQNLTLTNFYRYLDYKEYPITLDANEGTGGSASVTATYDSEELPEFTNPTKSGYVFAGWYDGETDGNGSGNLVINNIGELQANVAGFTGVGGIWTATEGKTVHAKWIAFSNVDTECWDGSTYKCGDIENFDTPEPTGSTVNWSTATWGNCSAPTAETDVALTENMIVDVTDAKAKSIVLKNGSASLTIAAGKALVVATTIKKTADGETLVATTPCDLTIQSSDAGTGALITGAADAATQATVEFYTKARYEDGYVNQYIGIPYNGMNAYDGYYGTALYRFDVDADAWRVLGANGHMDAFAAYNLLRREAEPATLSMTGTLNLPGTTETKDQVLTLTRRDVDVEASVNTENLFANSWTAPIDIKAMETEDFVGAEATVYIFNAGTKTEQQEHSGTMDSHDNTIAGQWVCLPVEAAELLAKKWNLTVIPSMQAFAVYAKGTVGDTHTLTLDYKKVVYDPAAASGAEIKPARAPRRASETDKPEIIRLNVTGESGNADQLILFLREDFSTGFDNGWEGRKIEGAAYTPQLYAVTDEGRMAISAQPDAESTLIGFKAGSEDTVYTFALDYEGEETEPLYLLDTRTDTYTRVEKDATYTFSTDDKSDHNRFVLTRNRAPQVVTGIEDVQSDNTKVVKFIENDQLYILRNGVIYDTTGKRVK